MGGGAVLSFLDVSVTISCSLLSCQSCSKTLHTFLRGRSPKKTDRRKLKNSLTKFAPLFFFCYDFSMKQEKQGKKSSLIISGVTALVCSRTLFLFFDDPEGPNLLVVVGMAGIIYFLAFAIYSFLPLSLTSIQTDTRKLALVIFIQIAIVVVFYFCLK